MKPERIGSSLNDAGFDEARRFSVADVSRLTGVPLPYLSEHQDTAYANQEWLGRIYVEGCLAHWAAAFDGERCSVATADADGWAALQLVDGAVELISVADMLKELKKRLTEFKELSVTTFFEEMRSRRELVTAFIAVLEIVRTEGIRLMQSATFGDIVLKKS